MSGTFPINSLHGRQGPASPVAVLAKSVRVHWRVVAGCILALVGIGALYSYTQKPTFEATTQLVVSAATASSATDANFGADYATQIAKTYATVAVSAAVLEPVANGRTLDQLQSNVSAIAANDTSTIQIMAEAASPNSAAALANSVSRSLIKVASDLTPQSATGQSPVKVSIINPATPDSKPIAPKPVINIILGLIVGATVGAVIAIGMDALDTRIRTVDRLAAQVDSPVLGAIPTRVASESASLASAEKSGARSEAFKKLRANLRYVTPDLSRGTWLITSSLPGEGKTSTAINLADTLQLSGRRTLLIEADLWRPSIASYLGIDGSVGLTNVMIDQLRPGLAIQMVGEGAFAVLPAGEVPPNPAELLQSTQFANVLHELQQQFDAIVIDAPPVLPVADAIVLASLVDSAIVVARLNQIGTRDLQQTFEQLSRTSMHVAGVVANDVTVKARGNAYGYRYSYANANHA